MLVDPQAEVVLLAVAGEKTSSNNPKRSTISRRMRKQKPIATGATVCRGSRYFVRPCSSRVRRGARLARGFRRA